MLHSKSWLVVVALALLLLVPSTVAFAQDENGDRVVFGQDYVLHSGETVDGDLTVVGGSVTLQDESTVTGDVLLLGGSLVVDGTVLGSLSVWGGSASLNEGAVVQGDLVTFGGSVHRAAGARVNGSTVQGVEGPKLSVPVPPMSLVPSASQTSSWRDGPLGDVARFLRWQLGTLGWGLLLAALSVLAVLMVPKPMERIATAAGGYPAVSLGFGLITLLAALLVGAVLLIACGLGLLVWLLSVIAILVGWIAVGLWLGQRVFQAAKLQQVSSLVEAALGVFLLTVAVRLPWCIGPLFGIIVGSIGLGAVMLTRFGTEPFEGRIRYISERVDRGPSGGSVKPASELAPTAQTEEPLVADAIEPDSSPFVGESDNPNAG